MWGHLPSRSWRHLSLICRHHIHPFTHPQRHTQAIWLHLPTLLFTGHHFMLMCTDLTAGLLMSVARNDGCYSLQGKRKACMIAMEISHLMFEILTWEKGRRRVPLRSYRMQEKSYLFQGEWIVWICWIKLELGESDITIHLAYCCLPVG